MAHWTHVLSNVSLAEYVLLAVLTTFQWARHRQRGAAWLALAFVILGGVSLTLKVDPASFGHEYVAKVLLALLLVLPYLLFRFTGTIRATARPVELSAGALTAGIVVYTFALGALPGDGRPTPPHFVAYRIAVLVAISFVCVAVVAALLLACRGEPRVAAARMRVLALAVAGLELQVIIAALGAPRCDRRPGHRGTHGNGRRPLPGGARLPLVRAAVRHRARGRGLPGRSQRVGVRR